MNTIIVVILSLVFLVLAIIIYFNFQQKDKKNYDFQYNKTISENMLYNEYYKEERVEIINFLASKEDLIEKIDKFVNYNNDIVLKKIVNNEEDYLLLKEIANKEKFPVSFLVYFYKNYFYNGCNSNCKCGFLTEDITKSVLKKHSLNFENIKCRNSCGSESWQIEGCENKKESKKLNFLIFTIYLKDLVKDSNYYLLVPSFLEKKSIKKEIKNKDDLINLLLELDEEKPGILKQYKSFVLFVYSLPIE